jgi:hypothetical protein
VRRPFLSPYRMSQVGRGVPDRNSRQADSPFMHGKALPPVTFSLYVEHAVREPQCLQRR